METEKHPIASNSKHDDPLYKQTTLNLKKIDKTARK